MGRYSEAVAAYTLANETDPFNIAASDGLETARKGEADAGRNMIILLVIVLAISVAAVFWYVRFRKPAEPAPAEKKSGKKK
jgi:flagellar basal body-associated protein FliL